MKKNKPEEVTRHISSSVSQLLWGRAAGRCQFSGHNIPLYKSSVTQESVHIAQKAHIYSFSDKGARGWGEFINNRKNLNNIDNLMLMCQSCHKLIDEDKTGERYSAELLRVWKKEHEDRVELVTGIAPDKKSHVVFYASTINKEKTRLNKDEAFSALFPVRYPADDQPIDLSMTWSLEDSSSIFWDTEVNNLTREFFGKISEIHASSNTKHFSLFAFAPMPLLIQLGALFTDKIAVDTYQPIREPQGWHWQNIPEDFNFIINEPEEITKQPVLAISLSVKIDYSRITSILGEEISIWEITVSKQHRHNDNIRHKSQLSQFRRTIREVLGRIKENNSLNIPLAIFPAMAISCSVEMGRVRMPKAEMPWIIYDQNQTNEEKKFFKTITIGEV